MVANLEWFRTFKAIYETGTMSGAAKELYISQPGVGLHLNALEAYTGFALFERTARKMIPTERGSLLYQQINASLVNLTDIEGRFKKKSGEERLTVSVGMCVETFQQALEKHIPTLDFNLIMQFDSNEKLVTALENGAIDLILTSETRGNNLLSFTPYTTEKLMLIAGKEMKKELEEMPDMQDFKTFKKWLKEQLWYNTAADMKLLIKFWEQNFKELPDFLPNYIVPNKFSIIRCLSAGKGLAVLPDYLCQKALETDEITVVWEGYSPVENPLYFGKRKKTLLMKEILHLENLLLKEFSK
ncbi:LysR family transcriptional regulator [Neptunitalea lumnitzerae]|uniref:LysR family transcriptional regulator n=1 Tax=Neptunitalea lumnitzerae TaxID=2965509 RepID=A0ABQ5MHW3_9FLAO|nr:LysR family transcriptional regulator [Neptunitalea sp. Y10]GLB48998.1 LysR family transcriptional regulator [Neptunitalea sp. Y10]